MASIALCACCSVSFSQLTLFPACGDMCKDFVPDLNFRFSLGMSAILVSVRSGWGGMTVMSDSPLAVMCSLSLQEKFNVGSSSTLQFLNVISGNQYLLLGGALVFGYLVCVDGRTDIHTHTRHNTISSVSFPFQISKLVTWEVVLSVGAVFGLLFGYERLTWTDSAKERAVKEQVGTLGGGEVPPLQCCRTVKCL